jgi:hypothetical protein
MYSIVGFLKLVLSFLMSSQVETPADKLPDLSKVSVSALSRQSRGYGSSSSSSNCIDDDDDDDQNAITSGFFARFGLYKQESVATVLKLSALFVVDAFAGGFVTNSAIVYWFHARYHLEESSLGAMLMTTSIIAGVSAILATPLVKLIGALKTMVYTHLPSNVLLMLIPLMPSASSAVVMLCLRFSISQMDVPARQAYVAMQVNSNERSAANGITNLVRSLGVSLSPLLLGQLLSFPTHSWQFAMPFYIAGGLKIIYDIAIWVSFVLNSPRDSN